MTRCTWRCSKAYWEQTGDIATIDGLKAIADSIGLDSATMAAELEEAAAKRYSTPTAGRRRRSASTASQPTYSLSATW